MRDGPVRLFGAQKLAVRLVQLQTLLAAFAGDASVQRHVPIVRLCGLINGQLGLLRPDGMRTGSTEARAADSVPSEWKRYSSPLQPHTAATESELVSRDICAFGERAARSKWNKMATKSLISNTMTKPQFRYNI